MKNKYERNSLEQNFSTSVTPLQRLWSVSADKAIAPGNGLSPALSWPLVVMTYLDQPLTQTELALLLGVERSSFTRLLDRLCESDLVERYRIEEDRRVNLLRLTRQGSVHGETLKSAVSDFRSQALDGITNEGLTTCPRVFERIQTNLSEASPPAAILRFSLNAVPSLRSYMTVDRIGRFACRRSGPDAFCHLRNIDSRSNPNT
ncbi:MarR family winged helix-turn-helix transcriptional regulator [Caballeronia sp. TF1N1]|uniref:MarR family winged helix-turn-helix transcriptional regulator n=1 Tax=Caballeronia sp. TF1N1 TaxID=2878153 RepID=UPI001FD1EEE1|nr:MarR family transcriptional regulator [Caballeronia sp. TF1N1]